MNAGNGYEKWLESRRQCRVPDGFAGQVMERIEEMERECTGMGARAAGGLLSHWLVRLALGCSLSALGLYRVSHVAVNLLLP